MDSKYNLRPKVVFNWSSVAPPYSSWACCWWPSSCRSRAGRAWGTAWSGVREASLFFHQGNDTSGSPLPPHWLSSTRQSNCKLGLCIQQLHTDCRQTDWGKDRLTVGSTLRWHLGRPFLTDLTDSTLKNQEAVRDRNQDKTLDWRQSVETLDI